MTGGRRGGVAYVFSYNIGVFFDVLFVVCTAVEDGVNFVAQGAVPPQPVLAVRVGAPLHEFVC